MAFFVPDGVAVVAGGNDFEEQWREGVRLVTAAYQALTPRLREKLRLLTASLQELRCSMQALAARAEAAAHCADCGGECCVAGKYHFTRADLLVYLVSDETLFEPTFGNGLCPYLGREGCLMPPQYRPFNCITFNCERIEDLLSESELASFYRMERELRLGYAEIRSLFPEPTMHGALLGEFR